MQRNARRYTARGLEDDYEAIPVPSYGKEAANEKGRAGGRGPTPTLQGGHKSSHHLPLESGQA